MFIISIYWGANASAALIKNGVVVSAYNEERFTRNKNEDKFPKFSIEACLKDNNLKKKDIDYVAIASYLQQSDETLLNKHSTFTIKDYVKEQHQFWYPKIFLKKNLRLKNIFKEKININQFPKNYWKNYNKKNFSFKKFGDDRIEIISQFLDIEKNKIYKIEHHLCHSYYAYLSSNFRNKKVLCFTVDGWGDGLNATISSFDKFGNYKRLYKTNKCNIARIYRHMTLLLGMKPNEHEFKVMGMAPYAKNNYIDNSLNIFRKTLGVSGINFKWINKPKDSYFSFKRMLEGERFDNIAGGLQKWVEELLSKWVLNSIKKFKIKDIVISGGVSMNMKAMGEIAKLKKVSNIFVGGSGSDESLALSAGLILYLKKTKNKKLLKTYKPIKNLYLGSENNFLEEEKIIKKLNKSKFKIIKDPTNKFITSKLESGKIIGRCVGKMEFGHRALCNRSIIADPINIDVKEKINAAIKNRDFWMPFAPVVLDKFENKYLNNKKKIASPYMTIGFDTSKTGYNAMKAACHPADKSARPQILKKNDNPIFYELLKTFSETTGRGALINTSFNLHGFPIVRTTKEAYTVFIKSKLDCLLLNNFLIIKK